MISGDKGAHNAAGRVGESLIYDLLSKEGYDVQWCPRGKGGDFIVSGKVMIDIKVSSPRDYQTGTGRRFWTFNLHHHKKRQSGIRYFVCIANGSTEEGDPTIFVMPGDLFTAKVLVISELQIQRGTYDHFKNNFGLIPKQP